MSYNFQFLGVRQTFADSTNSTRVSGLLAHTGGSYAVINSWAFQANLSEEEIYQQALELLREAERIAFERGCNSICGMVFDF